MNAAGNLRLAVVFEVENGELKSRLVDSQKAIDALGHAGRDAANDMDRASAATDRLGRELAGTEQAMGRTRTESQRTARAITDQARATDLAQRSTDRTTAALGSMRTALAGVGLALGVREVVQYADGWTLANNRLRLVTDSTGDLVAIQARLFDVSQQTRSGFEATVNLYSRMYQATRDLDTSSEDLVEVVVAIQQAFRVSGASAQEAENAVIQLSQGLASGTLRGDEFNSVMEQAPRLATAMTAALNVSRGELREMAAEGKISAETIITALRSQSDAIAAEFGQVNATIGDSLTTASNSLQRWIGDTDEAVGASALIADSIGFAARNMDLFAGATVTAATAVGTLKIASVFAGAPALIGRATGAMVAFNTAVRANPLGLLASVAASAITAMAAFGDGAYDAGDAADRYRQHLDRLRGSLDDTRESQDELNRSVATGRLSDVAEELKTAQADLAEAGAAVRQELESAVRGLEQRARTAPPGVNLGFDAVTIELREMLDAGTDAGRMLDVLQDHINAAFAAGDDKAARQLERLRQKVADAGDAYAGAEQEVLSLLAEAARLNRVLAQTGDTGSAAGRAIADGAIVAATALNTVAAAWAGAYQGMVAPGLDPQLAKLQELRAAAAGNKVVLDELTQTYVVSDRAQRVAAETQKILAEGTRVTTEAAQELAEQRVAEEDALRRHNDALQVEAQRRNEARQAAEQEVAQRRQAEQARLSTIAGIELEIAQTRQLTAALGRAVPEWNELSSAWRTGDREVRVLARQFDILSRSTEITTDEARRLAEQWVDATDAQSRAREEADRVTDALNDQAEAARRTGDEIQDALGDALDAILVDWDDGFGRLMENWARQGARTAFDLAATFARSLDLDNLSFPSLGSGSIPGVPGGSIALAGMAGSNLLGGNNGLISGGVGIAGGLINGFGNTFGSSALSYGLAQAPQTMVNMGLGTATNVGGQLIAAPSQLGSSLAGGINAAGWGVLGSTGAQLLGFESRNPYVGMALNTLGSVGGGIAGTAIGASIGGMAGSIGGPVGAIAGAALGQILSSQIGAGPSVGPNAAGHLAIAGDRWAVGGVGSDNGGDLSGVTQQLASAAQSLNSIMDQLQLSVADPSQSTWRFGLGSGAASPYSATNAQALVSQMLGSGLFQSADANVQRVLDSAGGSIDPASFQQDLQFAAGFSDAIAQWAAASAPAAAATNAAAAEIEALQNQIETFRATTERLGLDVATADNVTKQHVETLFGIREAAEPLGPIATYAANAEARLAAAGDMLDQLGITAESAAAGVERAIGRVAAAEAKSITAALYAATGRGAITEIGAILDESEARARDLEAGGQSTADLYALRDIQIAEIMADQSVEMVKSLSAEFGGVVAQMAGAELVARRQDAAAALAAEAGEMRTTAGVSAVGTVLDKFATLRTQAEDLGLAMDLSGLQAQDLAAAMARLDADALQEVMATYGKFDSVQEAATAALANLSTTAELAAEAEADAARQRMATFEEEARAAEQAASAWRQVADQLLDARAGLRLASSAALSPQLQLQETEAQYQEALQAALSGDREAAARLPELAAALQEAGLAWWGPSSEFGALKDVLQADLAEAAGLAGDQASIAEQQLSIAEAQLDELRRIANGGRDAGNALTDFFALGQDVRAGTATGDVIGQQHSIIDRMDATQLAVALQQAAPGGQAQQYIRQAIGSRGLTFDAAADSEARQAFTTLGQAVTAGTATGDIRAQQREILSEMGPEGLMWALGLVNPQGAAVGDIRSFLRDFGVPGFDSGGMAGAGLAWVGESGPELVNFPQPAEILDAGTSRRWIDAANGMGGNDRLVSLLERMVDQQERLLRGSRAGDAANVQLLGEIRGVLRDLAGEANRAASRPRERAF